MLNQTGKSNNLGKSHQIIQVECCNWNTLNQIFKSKIDDVQTALQRTQRKADQMTVQYNIIDRLQKCSHPRYKKLMKHKLLTDLTTNNAKSQDN